MNDIVIEYLDASAPVVTEAATLTPIVLDGVPVNVEVTGFAQVGEDIETPTEATVH